MRLLTLMGGDPFPFLQGIEGLLKTPMRNMTIEEVCGGVEEKCTEILEDKDVAGVLSWSKDPLDAKMEEKNTTSASPLGEDEGKWQTQRRQTRVSKNLEGGKEMKLDVGKMVTQNRRMQKMTREVASCRQPTLESMEKGRK